MITKIRMITAILVCKALRFTLRMLKRGGTAMPGKTALRICPGLLSMLSRDVKTVAVTGTNGKTTSSRMIEQAFTNKGLSYLANRSGANLISGVTTEFVANSSIFGKCRKEYAVIECDEAAAKAVFPQLKPKVILVTNLFRDQLDRYGEVTHTLDNIRQAIRGSEGSVLCLNADCSLTASLAGELPNKVLFFGVNKGATESREKPELSDASHCIHCKTEYEYDYISYGHLGSFRCPSCGYHRQDADYAVTELLSKDTDSSRIRLYAKGAEYTADINLPAMYNVYNAIGAVAAVTEMGLGTDSAIKALSEFKCGFGRMEQFKLAGGTKLMLVKNPAGCDQVIEFLGNVKESFVLVACLNDRSADGTDVSWIWDAHFEELSKVAGLLDKVIVSGDRAWDMATRLKYAGVAADKISVERDYGKLVSQLAELNTPVYIMPTYTAMLELRAKLVERCGGDEFWV